MKTSLLSIQPVKGTNEFKVMMLLGNNRQQLTFTVEHAEQESFTVIGGDINFCKFFRFNNWLNIRAYLSIFF